MSWAGLRCSVIMSFVAGLLTNHTIPKMQTGFTIEWPIQIGIIATSTLATCLVSAANNSHRSQMADTWRGTLAMRDCALDNSLLHDV